MGYGGKTVNGLSSLGPKMGGKAHGGGVKIEKGMGKISQSQDDVLSGKETKIENESMGSAKMISGGHSKGKFMSTPKYKIMQLSVIITADQTLTGGRALPLGKLCKCQCPLGPRPKCQALSIKSLL